VRAAGPSSGVATVTIKFHVLCVVAGTLALVTSQFRRIWAGSQVTGFDLFC
jgi:hypothetical protein